MKDCKYCNALLHTVTKRGQRSLDYPALPKNLLTIIHVDHILQITVGQQVRDAQGEVRHVYVVDRLPLPVEYE